MADIAVTGPGGRIGEYVLEALESDHSVTPIDKTEVEGWETELVDITDREAVVDALSGQDVVVHLAADSASSATWDDVREPNIEGTWNVYHAAAENDLDRVVFASSNHATHMYNTADAAEPNSQGPPGETRAVSPGDGFRPTGPYGISKVTGEAIGCYHADRYGIDVVNLRIGWVLDEAGLREKQRTDSDHYARAMMLSPRDLQDAIPKAATVTIPENPLTVNLTSANSDRYLSIVETMRTIGYDPADDSAEILGE